MSQHTSTQWALGPARQRTTGVGRLGGLLACLVVLSSAGCGRSGYDAAQDQVLQRAEQIAHETEPWATDSHNMEGWASNRSVLDRLVALSGGETLAISVHDPDERGVGLLATVEVVMVGVASEASWPGAEVHHYNVCVRFVVRREATGPRQITPVSIDCPHQIPATRAP
jgi:hypothetical protein